MPKFETMDAQVLKEISDCLMHTRYSGSDQRCASKGDQIEAMMFVTEGGLVVSESHGHREQEEHEDDSGWIKVNPGYFLGEELLDCVLDSSFPEILPRFTYHIEAKNVGILGLMATDLAKVVKKYPSHFSKDTTLGTDDKLDRLKKVSSLSMEAYALHTI